jgi:uncharacterized protein (DUF697 family)
MSWIDRLISAAKPGKHLTGEQRRDAASTVVTMGSMGAAAVTYAPIPLSDFLVVTPVQASMVLAVGRVYGREMNIAQAEEILLELASVCGLSMLAQKSFATVSKLLLPGLGGFLAGPWAFTVTYGLGHVAIRYFEDKRATREALKSVFEDAMSRGKDEFSREKLEEFRKERGDEVIAFAQEATHEGQGGDGEGAPQDGAEVKRPTLVKAPDEPKPSGGSSDA